MALTVMFFAGETLNILTILALVIAVGMLVDNSIVVAENIQRMHKEGLSRRDACVKGAGEIALAITMATLTTIVVFVPVSLVEGEGQFFLMRLALPISVSLAGLAARRPGVHSAERLSHVARERNRKTRHAVASGRTNGSMPSCGAFMS